MAQNLSYISTDKAVEDLNFMVNSIEKVHYNPYFKTNKADFYKYKEELLSSFNSDSIAVKQFIATGMKLSALLSGGHTAMDWQNEYIVSELMNYYFLPFTVKQSLLDTSFFVTRSAQKGISQGAEVKAINGVSIKELYEECMSYIGGLESFKNAYCEKVFPLYLFFTNKITHPYLIQLSDTVISTEGINVTEINDFLNSSMATENYTFTIIENEIGLINYNSCTDYDAFEVFLKKTFKEIDDKKIRKLIVDIRENSGGDSRLNDLLLSYITTKPYRQSSGRYWKVSKLAKAIYKQKNYENHFGEEFMDLYNGSEDGTIIEKLDEGLTYPQMPTNYFSGKTCFLIGPNTFSSANFLADAIKTYKISTLIGSVTGELTNDFGEVIYFLLPHSVNIVYVSSTYDIGANGNPNFFQAVDPDIQVDNHVLDYAIKWMK